MPVSYETYMVILSTVRVPSLSLLSMKMGRLLYCLGPFVIIELIDYFFTGAKMQALLDPSNLESAVQLVTKLDDSIKEISLQVRELIRMT